MAKDESAGAAKAAVAKKPSTKKLTTAVSSKSSGQSSSRQSSSRQNSQRQRRPSKSKKAASTSAKNLASLIQETPDLASLPEEDETNQEDAYSEPDASAALLAPAEEVAAVEPVAVPEAASSEPVESPKQAPSRPTVAAQTPASDQHFLWEFEPTLASTEALIERDGTQCKFPRASGTALLVSPPPGEPRAVTLRLLRASTYDSSLDAVGMCPPAAVQHLKDRSLAETTSVVMAVETEEEEEAGERSRRYEGLAVSAAGSFAVHTLAGDLAEARCTYGIEVGHEVRLSVDADETLSVAVGGVEIARFAGTPSDWRFAVSAGRLGQWEVVDEPEYLTIDTPLDPVASPHAFGRYGYAEDEAASAYSRTLIAMVAKRLRVQHGRRKQLQDYEQRQGAAAFAAFESQFQARCAEADAEDATGAEAGVVAAAEAEVQVVEGGAAQGAADGSSSGDDVADGSLSALAPAAAPAASPAAAPAAALAAALAAAAVPAAAPPAAAEGVNGVAAAPPEKKQRGRSRVQWLASGIAESAVDAELEVVKPSKQLELDPDLETIASLLRMLENEVQADKDTEPGKDETGENGERDESGEASR